MQQQITSLLAEVALKNKTLKEARNRFADKLAPDFSIFDYLRTDEVGLSRCIANLLDPTGKHGQKEVFLEAFLKKIGWSGNTKIRSVCLEKQANGQRRIDIYLQFQNGDIIGIENKPWAGDQKNQLSDYASFIEKKARDKEWMLIYLSNNEPSDYSGIREKQQQLGSKKKFTRLNYSIIIEWLEDCACKSKALIVRLFIEELAKYIRMNINGELEMSEENEIRNLILDSLENIESAFHVSIAMKSVKEKLLKEFRDDLNQKLQIKGFELVWDDAMSKFWKAKAGFGVKFSEKQNLYLRFEFDSSGLHGLYWGIARRDSSVKEDDAIWKKISDVMSDQFGSSGRPEQWLWWSWIDNKEFNNIFRNWDSSEAPWILMKKKELAGEFVDLAIRVHYAFDKHQNLRLLSGEISSE